VTKVIRPIDLLPDREPVAVRFEPLVLCPTSGCESLKEPGSGPCEFCRGKHNRATRKRKAKEERQRG
jgi:hypothetical protein